MYKKTIQNEVVEMVSVTPEYLGTRLKHLRPVVRLQNDKKG